MSEINRGAEEGGVFRTILGSPLSVKINKMILCTYYKNRKGALHRPIPYMTRIIDLTFLFPSFLRS